MRLYEGIFVFAPNVTPEDRKAHEKNVEALVAKQGGKVKARQDLGKRSLGYEVKKFREGFFTLIDFDMEPAKVDDFRRSVQVSADVVKFFVTVKDEELQKAAAAAAKKAAAPASETPEMVQKS